MPRPAIRTLIVDDSPDFIRAACERLAGETELTVIGTADSGFAAIRAVHELHPELVLMNVGMPGMSGVEATRRVKELASSPCVVLMTLKNTKAIRAAAREAGADAIFSKGELGDSIEAILRAVGGDPEHSRFLA
jgi:DNA-binding NarL/FixJ family response regulator